MNKKFLLIIMFLSIIGIIFFFYGDSSFETRVVQSNDQLMISIDGVESSTFPTSGDYYLSKYECKSKSTVVSWDKDKYQLSVTNGNKKGEVACYVEFSSTPKLANMEIGSYVAYMGNNGCIGNQCLGENANAVSNSHLGYCNNDNSEFFSSGFRILYSSEGSAYLVTAGSPECFCTDSNGNISKNCEKAVSLENIQLHFDVLNNVALKYCNTNYVANGICDFTTVRNINENDFDRVIQNKYNLGLCYGLQNKQCGYTNKLIDIGSDYWFNANYSGDSNKILYWSSSRRLVWNSTSNFAFGLRPVIKLDSNVIVVGGTGSQEDPYLIANNAILSMEEVDNQLKLDMIGYQVSEMCINLNSTACTNYVPFNEEYTLDISRAKEKNVVYVYYKDKKGNIVATISKEFIKVESEENLEDSVVEEEKVEDNNEETES